ncbi:hypothetical protein VP1G_00903 [Cytospora mali]|uniref:Uncharacterized protein n=1 Tax=Cytospora mali TaxID=578113 RepID=A0A194UP62_CYTMA|nr:hypothetical protein VP1G_00903 [Valsa mali var. pyri (nom. inval.)]
MKTLNFLVASVAILSSLAVAAPVDTKREELYGPSEDLYSLGVLKLKLTKDDLGSDKKREELYGPSEDLYSKLTLAAKKDKREELYGPSSDLYSVALLRGDVKRDNVGTGEA